ncbi:MAG: nucleotidyltransferase domain-containing protein [Chitinophagaceae bacterium]|nr:nucleotidyltransferase domain-containing protein [Chitinophagaceae bacterium]
MKLPKEKQALLNDIADDLKAIGNIRALVLGGSYATGTATAGSDLDIGIYYSGTNPFDIGQIRSIAQKYAQDKPPTVTGFYEWGRWVNGGAWIETAAGKADLLYKNIEQITTTIEQAKNGIWENDFEQQPPYGFSSIIYLAETQACIPLWDPEGVIEKLKSEVRQYPPKLKQSVIQQSLWSAEFTIWQAANLAAQHDIYATAGCLTRAVKNITAALFGINELYPMGDKRTIDSLEKAATTPNDLRARIAQILCVNKDRPDENVHRLKALWQETVQLAPGMYTPFYNL